jgi:hypothetical protein
MALFGLEKMHVTVHCCMLVAGCSGTGLIIIGVALLQYQRRDIDMFIQT